MCYCTASAGTYGGALLVRLHLSPRYKENVASAQQARRTTLNLSLCQRLISGAGHWIENGISCCCQVKKLSQTLKKSFPDVTDTSSHIQCVRHITQKRAPSWLALK